MNRGGSWNNSPQNCRSAYRNYNTPSNRNNNLGFRVARSFARRVDACRTKPDAFPPEPCLHVQAKQTPIARCWQPYSANAPGDHFSEKVIVSVRIEMFSVCHPLRLGVFARDILF